MRFAFHTLGLDIELKPNMATFLVIENPKAKRELIEDLWKQYIGEMGEGAFSENGKDFIVGRQIEVILNPFSLDFNSKRIKARLIEEANEVVDEFEYYSFLELKTSLSSFLTEFWKGCRIQ